ncbi:hypothetical protein HFD88_008107 [Aspergillus terreus]|nr:hypothetical protein HFD88_008107 [Aspergillus terreus]
MVFYNLAFFRGDHWDSGGGRDNRYLIIAANRGVADYLFRLLQERSDPVNRKAEFHELKRMSPQMWSWCGESDRALYNFIENVNLGKANLPHDVSRRIRGQVFFQGLGNWDNSARIYPILPDLDVADHIHGKIFCIRNKRVPQRFWSSDTKGAIVISTIKRAKFRIEIKGKPNVENPLMVPWDDVQLKLMRQASDQDQAHGEYPITMKDDGSLAAKTGYVRNPFYFKLGDLFTGRFGIAVQEKEGAKESNEQETLVPVVCDELFEGGEVWELC